MYYNINKHKETKARFSRLLRHPAWKRRGPILISALQKFVTYLLTYTLTHLLTVPGPTWGILIITRQLPVKAALLESPQSRPHWLLLIYSFQFRSAFCAVPARHQQCFPHGHSSGFNSTDNDIANNNLDCTAPEFKDFKGTDRHRVKC